MSAADRCITDFIYINHLKPIGYFMYHIQKFYMIFMFGLCAVYGSQ